MTYRPYFTVAGRAAGKLPLLMAPWVEYQIAKLPADFRGDILLRDNPLYLAEPRPRDFAPEVAGQMMADLCSIYKKSLMVFRWIANAILHANQIRETRPAPNYRTEALIKIANALSQHFEVDPELQEGEFRNPLRLVVETVYDGLAQVTDDEIALFFLMLAEAVGVPSRIVVQGGTRTGWRVYTECQIDDRSWFPFDFVAPKWGISPKGGTRHKFSADGGPESKSKRQYGIAARQAVGRPPVSEQVVGSGRTDWCAYWQQPKNHPEWFADLDAALKQLPENFHGGFLTNPYYEQAGISVAENFGPERTGAIIAYMTRLYSERYGDIFRRIVHSALQEAGVGPNSPVLRVAEAIADLVRTVFPYAEETVGVEEITSPLRMWWFHCHYPGVQKFDCDDLTTCYMTLAESCGIPTGIRLAGDAGQRDKYHVYPFVVTNDGQHVVYDVSAPNRWGHEMSRGKNFVDYVPRERDTYESHFHRRPQRRTAAGYVPGGMFMAGQRTVAGFHPFRRR